MKTIFTENRAGHAATNSEFLHDDRKRLYATLHEASQRAAQLKHAVLASFTLPVQCYDALSILSAFKQLQIGECIFWEHPSQKNALVGAGVATTIETTGSRCFASATAAWRSLQQHAIVQHVHQALPCTIGGPILLGGFAFDPLAPRIPIWDGFPDGLLVLPSILFHSHGQHASLTLNKMVQENDDVAKLLDEMLALLQRLQDAIMPHPSTVCGQGERLVVSQELPSASQWQEIVAHAVHNIQRGAYKKVVLARSVRLTRKGEPFAIEETLMRLRANYPEAYVFVIQRGEHFFIGATPERLVYAQQGQLRTMALAGSAPRGMTEEEDKHLRIVHLQNEKNKQEHAIVVTTIQAALASLCSNVHVADAPHLLQLKNIQHLQTPIVGDLLPGRCILEALEKLHPTPAVGGFPSQVALATIRNNEQLDRGWYAGPIGWLDAKGNGEFAVALRCALVAGEQATLFAGCGIVADSTPESEYTETCWKLQVMQRTLCSGD